MDLNQLRQRMVKQQIADRGVSDPLVLSAVRRVARENFVLSEFLDVSYRDGALPIGHGQTISQPYVVAAMIEALQLRGGETVLEIGTGSGYAAAVIAEIANKVITIERIEKLADRARNTLGKLNYDNVEVITGDGTKGWKKLAPYDAILVSASSTKVPVLLRIQLKIRGRIVIPVGPKGDYQTLVCITRTTQKEYHSENLCDVRFVPLVSGVENQSRLQD